MNAFALKDMLAKIVKVSVYKENVGPVLVRSCQTCPINLCVQLVSTECSNAASGQALNFFIHRAAYGTESFFGLVSPQNEFTYIYIILFLIFRKFQ